MRSLVIFGLIGFSAAPSLGFTPQQATLPTPHDVLVVPEDMMDGDMMESIGAGTPLPLDGPKLVETRVTAFPLTLEGGWSAKRLDWAPITLGEDVFLAPLSGNAALHLDVPFESDVLVRYRFRPADGSAARDIEHWLQSRGRYRHLILRGLPAGRREKVEVTVHLPNQHPALTKVVGPWSVNIKAGDRKHLRFRLAEFQRQPGG